MPSRMILCLAMLAVGACSSAADSDEATGANAKAIVTGDAPAESSATAVAASTQEGVKVSEKTDLYSFDFAYPAQAAAIPELKAKFDKVLETNRSKLMAEAREAQADAKEMDFPYHPYAEGTEWLVVADTPRFLSLSAAIYTYTGGAHPNHGSTSLVWDREAGQELKPIEFFVAPDSFMQAVQQRYCAALDKERAKRLGDRAGEGSGIFSECPKVGELTVLLGSSNGKTFNRIGLIADPYVAGSYAEGSYDITVPVDAAVLAAVKPEYAAAFSVMR